MSEGLSEHIALRPDPSTRRTRDGTVLLGGAPLRVLRFSPAGADAVERALSGRPLGGDAATHLVARRLLDAGMAHPVPVARHRPVSVVIPAHDDALTVADLVQRLRADPDLPASTEVIVVDDGSADGDAVRRAVGDDATLVRLPVNRGPGAARNAGWRLASAEVVVFVDVDVRPTPGWLPVLLGHLDDERVGLVAPRVAGGFVGEPTGTARERWEAARSPLDLGPDPAIVAPRRRVAYVPAAALVARRRTLEDLDGFDEETRVGEDVDLVWRAHDAGWRTRYEPAVVVGHRPRPSWTTMARQRFGYGTAAAALDARHPGRVAPLEGNVWSLVAWALALTGRGAGLAAATALTAGSTAALVPRLRDRVDRPARTAIVLAGGGTVHLGVWLGRAIWRAWLPLVLPVAIFSRRARAVLAAAAVGPALVDWVRRRPALDPVRWSGLWAADDAAYCAGVWWGARRIRSLRCLLPRLTGIPGITDRTDPSDRSGRSDPTDGTGSPTPKDLAVPP